MLSLQTFSSLFLLSFPTALGCCVLVLTPTLFSLYVWVIIGLFSSSSIFPLTWVKSTDEPVEGILHLLSCFYFLAFTLDFFFSAEVTHPFMYVVYIFH